MGAEDRGKPARTGTNRSGTPRRNLGSCLASCGWHRPGCRCFCLPPGGALQRALQRSRPRAGAAVPAHPALGRPASALLIAPTAVLPRGCRATTGRDDGPVRSAERGRCPASGSQSDHNAGGGAAAARAGWASAPARLCRASCRRSSSPSSLAGSGQAARRRGLLHSTASGALQEPHHVGRIGLERSVLLARETTKGRDHDLTGRHAPGCRGAPAH